MVDNYQKLTSQAVFVLTGLNFYWGNTDKILALKSASLHKLPVYGSCSSMISSIIKYTLQNQRREMYTLYLDNLPSVILVIISLNQQGTKLYVT